jgi:hypothetical protein
MIRCNIDGGTTKMPRSSDAGSPSVRLDAACMSWISSTSFSVRPGRGFMAQQIRPRR